MNETETVTYLTAGFEWQAQLAEVEQAFAEGSMTLAEIRRELNAIWPNAIRARDWCFERAKTDARAAMLCSKLAGCAGNLLDQERGRHVLIEWREDAVEAIVHTLPLGVLPKEYQDDMVHDLMGHLTYLGYLHMANGNMARAREVLRRTIVEGATYDSHFADKVAYLHLAMVDIREDKPDDAVANLRMAIEMSEGDEGVSTSASAHNLLGVIASRQGDSAEAAAEYEQAIRLFEVLQDRSGQGTTHANLSGVLLDLGRREEAERHLEIAESIAHSLNSPNLRALNALNRGRLMIDEGCLDSVKIMELLQAALDDFSFLGDIPQMRHVEAQMETLLRSALNGDGDPLTHEQRSYALRRLGELASSRGDRETQIDLMEQLLDEAVSSQDVEDELLALGQLGHAKLLQGDYEPAAAYLERALIVLSHFPDPSTLAKAECEISLSLGQCRRHLGQAADAERNYARAQILAELLGDNEALSRAVGNRALLNVDAGRCADAIRALSKLVATLRDSGDFRLTAHARFNLAFAYFRSGDLRAAQIEGEAAREVLERIGDESAEEVRRQMATWGEP